MKQLQIFCDFHHDSLFTSLQMLFENRLGYKLFRPIGEEWFKRGFWKLAEPYGDNPSTITQYLGIRDMVPLELRQLNEIIDTAQDYYLIKGNPFDHKAVTYDQFRKMKIDIVIASYEPHIVPYSVLADEKKAKFIHQQGNEWQVNFKIVKNLLASVLPYKVSENVNACFYHQEFNTEMYKYGKLSETKIIRSFVNCLSSQGLFRKDWETFLELETYLPEYKFESYGATTREGAIKDQQAIANMMRESMFGFHLKTGGDGYGHTFFNWASVGRPLIYRSSQYKDRLGSKLLIHGVTGIDLDKVSLTQAVNIIRNMDKKEYEKMCIDIHNKFIEEVNFDIEEQEIRKFLENLK